MLGIELVVRANLGILDGAEGADGDAGRHWARCCDQVWAAWFYLANENPAVADFTEDCFAIIFAGVRIC